MPVHDLDEVPKEVQDAIEFCWVQKMDQVLEYALESMPKPTEKVEGDGGTEPRVTMPGGSAAPAQQAGNTN